MTFYSIKDPGLEYKIECEDCDLVKESHNVLNFIAVVVNHLADTSTNTHVLRIDTL